MSFSCVVLYNCCGNARPKKHHVAGSTKSKMYPNKVLHTRQFAQVKTDF